MNRRIALITLLVLLLWVPVVYVFLIHPEIEMPRTSEDFGFKDVWLLVAPSAGMILWIWALYDWGTRIFNRGKFVWLIVLISTFYVGATMYFIAVGMKKKSSTAVH